MKKYLLNLFIISALCFAAFTANAQEEKKPDWRKLHYLSEEEMNSPVRNENFVETDPPVGEPRFVGEFEPMQAVLIRYPLGITMEIVRELAEDCTLITVVSSSYESQARSQYQNNGVNMDHCLFVTAPTDSYWVRDYGPWYIFEDKEPAIVDNVYNRPRPNDDNISGVFANYWNIPMYGMNLEHTGGNMMEDGRGHGVSDNLVIQENGNNETNVRNKMRDYLGIDPYHITIDPQGAYIAHVDCWGKYLAPDKILIAQLPQSSSQYALYEQVAEYFATTNCCWGYPYRVYRVQEPGGSTLAPYTNSLILNNKVFVPLGTNASYNQQAIATYQEAMPGYEILGFENNDWSIGWENTDALHCRTRGVMDFNMLFVDHRDVVFGEQEWQDSIAITSKFIAYSGEDLKQDSLLIYYSIDGGEYQVAHMTATGNPDEYVGYIKGYQGLSEINYYVFGADESGHRYQQPVFGELDPHHFTMEDHEVEQLLAFDVEEIVIDEEPFEIFNATNNTNKEITVNEIVENETEYLNFYTSVSTNPVELPYTLQPGMTMKICVEYQVPVAKIYVETSMSIITSSAIQTLPVTIDGSWEGINENVASSLEVYPNPVRNTLFINHTDIQNVTIFNAVGQQILFVENRNEIGVENLESGFYFVKIVDKKNNSVVRKIVKR